MTYLTDNSEELTKYHMELEKNFDCACQDVIQELSSQYKSEYEAGGPGKLEAFFELIKSAFEKVQAVFIEENNIGEDKEALKMINSIAKSYAKKCISDYGKVQ